MSVTIQIMSSTMTEDLQYFRRRERQERALAQAARSHAIARLHAEMADHFLREGNALSGPVPILYLVANE